MSSIVKWFNRLFSAHSSPNTLLCCSSDGPADCRNPVWAPLSALQISTSVDLSPAMDIETNGITLTRSKKAPATKMPHTSTIFHLFSIDIVCICLTHTMTKLVGKSATVGTHRHTCATKAQQNESKLEGFLLWDPKTNDVHWFPIVFLSNKPNGQQLCTRHVASAGSARRRSLGEP